VSPPTRESSHESRLPSWAGQGLPRREVARNAVACTLHGLYGLAAATPAVEQRSLGQYPVTTLPWKEGGDGGEHTHTPVNMAWAGPSLTSAAGA
jgi:hypothetical protein